MKKQLTETILSLERVNSILKERISPKDFAEQVENITIYIKSQEKINVLLDKLTNYNLEDIESLDELLMYLNLEYGNIVWVLSERQDLIKKLIILDRNT